MSAVLIRPAKYVHRVVIEFLCPEPTNTEEIIRLGDGTMTTRIGDMIPLLGFGPDSKRPTMLEISGRVVSHHQKYKKSIRIRKATPSPTPTMAPGLLGDWSISGDNAYGGLVMKWSKRKRAANKRTNNKKKS